MNAISVHKLTKKYGKLTAVDNIDLEIKQGEIFGLLGPNGAGKTTTLMILSTLIKPTSGEAFVNGYDVKKNPAEVRGSIGMVFQDPSSDDILTGYENLKLHALMYDVPWRTIDGKIDKVLELVDLNDRKNSRVKTYSGGMRRRMEIARGLLHEPKILFLDEPTIGLDPQTREHIWTYISDLAKRRNMTIILTTHYMEEADKLCDRIAIVDRGKIIALDTPFNLKNALGGDTVTLKGERLNRDALTKLPFVKKTEIAENVFKLWVENSSRVLPEILKAAGIVESVESHAPDMNDVFLSLTGRQIREEEGNLTDQLRNFSKVK